MVPFMSHLATQLGYSAGEFQALQLIVLAAFGVVDFLYFDICNYICLDTSYHFFGFIFTSKIFFIFSSTPVLTSSIDVVFILSIE